MVEDEVHDLLNMVGDNPVNAVIRRQVDWVIAYQPLPAG